MDPCYISPEVLLATYEVLLLTTVEEDEWFFTPESRFDGSSPVDSRDVGVWVLVEYRVDLGSSIRYRDSIIARDTYAARMYAQRLFKCTTGGQQSSFILQAQLPCSSNYGKYSGAQV